MIYTAISDILMSFYYGSEIYMDFFIDDKNWYNLYVSLEFIDTVLLMDYTLCCVLLSIDRSVTSQSLVYILGRGPRS